MNYDYLICGLRVRFTIPWAVKTTAESQAFLTSWETDDAPDLTVNFITADALDDPVFGTLILITSIGKKNREVGTVQFGVNRPTVVWSGKRHRPIL